MKSKQHPSVAKLWKGFLLKNAEYNSCVINDLFYFCDNKKDADDCAELVVNKIKQATAPSLWWFKKNNEKLPEPGDINIVTNWNGEAVAIVQTTKVNQVPFNKITPEFAVCEGEGDKSLAYWNKVHWDYYTREMKPFGEVPTKDMIVVCEYFKTIWVV